jgi:hypothetical protein
MHVIIHCIKLSNLICSIFDWEARLEILFVQQLLNSINENKAMSSIFLHLVIMIKFIGSIHVELADNHLDEKYEKTFR